MYERKNEMKIRTGFVSNSSSTSFVIYGVRINREDLIIKITDNEKLEERIVKFAQKRWDEYHLPEIEKPEKVQDIPNWQLPIVLEEVFPKNLKVYKAPWDALYIGRNWEEIGNDETGGQLKDCVQRMFKYIFGVTIKCETIRETWDS